MLIARIGSRLGLAPRATSFTDVRTVGDLAALYQPASRRSDDESLARERTRRMLADLPGVVVAGEAGSAEEARQRIAELEPDLLLLDIQMPGEDGFALLQSLETRPAIIFVHGGPGVLLACGGPSVLRGPSAPSLLEPSGSRAWSRAACARTS